MVLVRPLGDDHLKQHQVFKPLVESWRAGRDCGSDFFTPEIRKGVSEISAGKFCLLRLLSVDNSGEPTLFLDEVGVGFPRPVVEFLSPVLGQPINHHKDELYRNYVVQTYVNVASSCHPMAHEVDAVIEANGFGKMRRQYQRLILPFATDNGQPLMASMPIALVPVASWVS